MARRIRFVPPGSLVEVTCRTLQGRLLLRPSPILRDLTLGVLARAARLYPVEVHAFAFLSNHFHLLLTPSDAKRLAGFMNYLNSNLAREAGRLVRWREKFWGRRFQAILVTDEPEAQVARLRYVLSQGVKEGLVASPVDWPGAHCARFLFDDVPIVGQWVDRTLEYAAHRKHLPVQPGDFSTTETLALAPLPCWRHRDSASRSALVRDLVSGIEAEAAAREAQTGKPPHGREFVFRQDPHLPPNRLKRGPAPLIHAASRAARDSLWEAYRIFLAAHRRATEHLRCMAREDLFPDGSFPPSLPFKSPAVTF